MADALLDRWLRLRADAKHHKAAIRRHREQLGATMAALAQLEGDCRRRGIALEERPPRDPSVARTPAA